MLYKIRYGLYFTLLILTMVVVMPVFVLRPFSPKNSFLFFMVFEQVCKYLLNIHLHTEGREIIKECRPAVLIGNHQHNFDVTVAAAVYTKFVVVLGKFELGLIPFFGQIYVLGGNILVKRGNRKKAMASMDKLAKKINKNRLSVLVFPEGHRNRHKELLPFKKGAYYTAIRTNAPLIPFAVSQFVDHYYPINGWKKIDIYIKISPPISVEGKTNKDIPQLITESRKIIEDGIIEMNKNYQ